MIHTNHSFMNSLSMRRKLDEVRKTVCHKAINLICSCITRELESVLKLYNRELYSTIDAYKIQRLSLYTQRKSPNRGMPSFPRLGVSSVKLVLISFFKCHLNYAWLL